MDIAGNNDYCEDKLQIISDKDLSTKLVDDICGNTLPSKITHKVEFPVTVRFISDIDHRQHKGFKLDYKIQFESGRYFRHYGAVTVKDWKSQKHCYILPLLYIRCFLNSQIVIRFLAIINKILILLKPLT